LIIIKINELTEQVPLFLKHFSVSALWPVFLHFLPEHFSVEV